MENENIILNELSEILNPPRIVNVKNFKRFYKKYENLEWLQFEIIERNPKLFTFFNEKAKKNKEVALKAISKISSLYKEIDESLKSDSDILALTLKNVNNFRFLPDSFKEDINFLTTMLTNEYENKLNYQCPIVYASEKIIDENLIFLAIKNWGASFLLLSQFNRYSKKISIGDFVCENNPESLFVLSIENPIFLNKDKMIESFQSHSAHYPKLPLKYRREYYFAEKYLDYLVKNYSENDIDDPIEKSEKLNFEILKNSLISLPDNLHNDNEFMFKLFSIIPSYSKDLGKYYNPSDSSGKYLIIEDPYQYLKTTIEKKEMLENINNLALKNNIKKKL